MTSHHTVDTVGTVNPVVVHFRYQGGEYQLEVDASAARRLADAEDSFPSEPRPHSRLLEHLLTRHRGRTA